MKRPSLIRVAILFVALLIVSPLVITLIHWRTSKPIFIAINNDSPLPIHVIAGITQGGTSLMPNPEQLPGDIANTVTDTIQLEPRQRFKGTPFLRSENLARTSYYLLFFTKIPQKNVPIGIVVLEKNTLASTEEHRPLQITVTASGHLFVQVFKSLDDSAIRNIILQEQRKLN